VFLLPLHKIQIQYQMIKWLMRNKSGDQRSRDIYPIFFMISHLLLGLTIHISNFRQSKTQIRNNYCGCESYRPSKIFTFAKKYIEKIIRLNKEIRRKFLYQEIFILNKLFFSTHRTLLEFVLILQK
jgi:hypothetical protein